MPYNSNRDAGQVLPTGQIDSTIHVYTKSKKKGLICIFYQVNKINRWIVQSLLLEMIIETTTDLNLWMLKWMSRFL